MTSITANTWTGATVSDPVFFTIYTFGGGYYQWDGDNLVETDVEKFELKSNKTDTYSGSSSTLYVSQKGVNDGLATKQDIIQFGTMPTASITYVDKIIQFTGTTGTYTNGYFYKGIATVVGETTIYSWERIDIQPSSIQLFDRIVAVPSGNLLSGDNSELTKSSYPKGYEAVLAYKNNAEQGNIFIGTHNINNAVDYCIVGGVEYIITSDNKLKVWKKPDESTPAEWVTLATYNRIGTKIIVNGTKIIFLYSDSDFGPDINTGIAVCNTLDDSCVKIPLWVTDGSIWHTSRESLHLVGEYISFRNNTAIPIVNLTAEALVTTTQQAKAYWKSKYWTTDSMNLFVSTTITGEYSSVAGIERPIDLMPLSEQELFVHCTADGFNKNYIFNETIFVEKTAKDIDEVVCYNQGNIFGFKETKILSSSDKGLTWIEQNLTDTIKSIGCFQDSDSITVTTSTAIYLKEFGFINYVDTITLEDTSTVNVNYYKNGSIKICLPEEQSKLDSIFTDKGILDYFVLAETSEYFKIPRANLPETFSGIGLQKCWYIN